MSEPRASRFDRIVRCGDGHLFTTIWVPFVSFKSVRLGGTRLQRCPIARHWSRVTPVDEATLTPDEIAEARRHHDLRIP
jgi:hypothetical protein